MVETLNLGSSQAVTSMLQSNSILVEIDGSIRRITLDNFMTAIQTGSLDIKQYGWGVPLKQNQSSQSWGRVGNTAMWEAFKSEVGRYLLTNDGSKMAKLSKTNSAYFADGTAVNESKGHVMVSGPRLYYDVRADATTGIPVLWGSYQPISKHYIDTPILAAYWGYLLDGKLVSRSGYVATRSKTISQFHSYARANGNGFGLYNYEQALKYIFMLNLFEFGNPNVQENIGYGCCGDGNTWDAVNNVVRTGATISLGDSCGAIDISSVAGNAKSCRVSLFGLEDLYGLYWNMIQGIYFGSSNNDGQTGSEVFIYSGNRMPTETELATHPNGDYRQITRLTREGWIQEMIFGEFLDILPKKLGGGSGSYLGDYTYNNATGQLCLWGGIASYGTSCGLGCSNSSNDSSFSYPGCGARLAYYGKPTIVNGADL